MFIKKYNPQSINLFGFDLHVLPNKISNINHYNKIKKNKFFKSIFITSDQHDYFSTYNFIKSLNKQKIINVDLNLRKILDFKYNGKKQIYILNNQKDISRLINIFKKNYSLNKIQSYNLNLSQKFIDNKENIKKLNNFNTFNKVHKFIEINYNKNLNYFKSDINTDLFNLKNIYSKSEREKIRVFVANRNSILHKIVKVKKWQEFFKFQKKLRQNMIIINISYNIKVFSKCLLLRLFTKDDSYIDIPLMNGSNIGCRLFANNLGELKMKILDANIDNKASWKIKSLNISFC